jgi:trk system potassium uptake protein TrkA
MANKKQFAVIGLGRFGSSLALTLVQEGFEVFGIDKDEDVVNRWANKLTHAVAANTVDEDALRSLGLRNFDCAIVAIGDDVQANILTSQLLKELGVKTVVAKALSDIHGKVLARIGVDRVIFPERDMGERVAHQLISPNLLDFIELSKEYSIAELSVPAKISGRTLRDLNLRANYGFSVVAIKRKNGIVIAPTADDRLEQSDIMVVIGTLVQIEQFERNVSY